jgi:general secretion pathway protein G
MLMRRKRLRRGEKSRRSGFTLMEVLLVLVILVILGGMATLAFQNVRAGALKRSAASQIGLFESAISAYELDMNAYPPNLEALRAAPPEDTGSWSGPYLNKEIPLDPWGNPYQYASPGTRNADTYDAWSMGPDKQDGSADDIGNWTQTT